MNFMDSMSFGGEAALKITQKHDFMKFRVRDTKIPKCTLDKMYTVFPIGAYILRCLGLRAGLCEISAGVERESLGG